MSDSLNAVAPVLAQTFVMPASYAQQRMWFIEQLEPGTGAYNIPAAVRLRGCLDITALKQSLQEITRRHEVLRTGFAVADGELVQVIHEDLDMALPEEDLTKLSDAEKEEQVRFAVQREQE